VDVLRHALDLLRDSGTKLDDAGLRRPTLDDAFLTLTGSPPSAGDGSEGDAAAEPAGTKVTG
jgi:ABC-2 type transport system ATP-binding protein